ncbi:response regulator [Vibrio nigripulchritudo ATCC 27043]|uniref:winged helix-turn-helix domain-containing protein n=1 Tax=Vibrio nigripulchritudo TaxID=28173 RepID=UPI00021C1C5B|nr:response regulator transcription factor [Vibrio nigripulchritudo]EGU54361.1 response regulator [Vibrio nigripulchritudo ATCC 27043]
MKSDFETIQYNVAYITDRNFGKESTSHYIENIKVSMYFTSLEDFNAEIFRNISLIKNLNLSAILIDRALTSRTDLNRINQFIREIGISSVIIFRDKSNGASIMNSGADDFLFPPYSPEELLLRVVNVIQKQYRSSVNSSNHVSFGKYSLHLETRELRSRHFNRTLTDGEHTLLLHLIGNQGKFSSREELSLALGKKRHPMSSRSVDMLIGRLRKKIDDNPKMPQYIVTSRGKGYMLVREPE